LHAITVCFTLAKCQDCNRVCNQLQSWLQSQLQSCSSYLCNFLCVLKIGGVSRQTVLAAGLCQQTNCVGSRSSVIWQAAPAAESACCWLLPMAAATWLLPWHPLNLLRLGSTVVNYKGVKGNH
jgi:hypothetical protein